MGLGEQFILSSGLIDALNHHGITYLYQALNIARTNHLSSYWKDGATLGLFGDLAKEWEDYQSVLLGAGIQLLEREDELLWAGGDKSGILSVKNLYKALKEIFWHHTIKGWRYKLWKWNVALKLKLFFWLILGNKVLT